MRKEFYKLIKGHNNEIKNVNLFTCTLEKAHLGFFLVFRLIFILKKKF